MNQIKKQGFQDMLLYNMEIVNSREIDTATYQRKLDMHKVDRIVASFNERIANEPKLSYRSGKYYVFDGQHTIAARKIMNQGQDIDIVCKVFYDLTQEEEAKLFAAQTGVSSKPTSGVTLKAKMIGNDDEALRFIEATEVAGIHPSFGDVRGNYRLRCINTAIKEFRQIGAKQYTEAMKIIATAWSGKPSSLIAEVVSAVCGFAHIYYGEYDRANLIRKLSYVDPYEIVRAVRNAEDDGGLKNGLKLILDIYNNGMTKKLLTVRF